MHLRLVDPQSLDTEKWDKLVNASNFPRLYGKKWYLDAMTGNRWLALVGDDYSYGMPLMVHKLFFFKWVRPPYLCRQMGPYFTDPSCGDAGVCKMVLSFLKKNFILTDQLVSNAWQHSAGLTSVRQNHILWLGKDYETLSQAYNRNTRRNISKAQQDGVSVSLYTDTAAFAAFMEAHDPTGTVKKIKPQMAVMVAAALERKQGHILKAAVGDSTVAMAFYIKEQDRLYFTLCASDNKGKESRAMYLLIDHIIRSNADTKKYLDFTGSSIPSIARRNESFGAEAEQHYYLRLNCLTKL